MSARKKSDASTWARSGPAGRQVLRANSSVCRNNSTRGQSPDRFHLTPIITFRVPVFWEADFTQRHGFAYKGQQGAVSIEFQPNVGKIGSSLSFQVLVRPDHRYHHYRCTADDDTRASNGKEKKKTPKNNIAFSEFIDVRKTAAAVIV